MQFQRIFVALDESQLCQWVFDRAVDIAPSNSASLLLFHCLAPDNIGQSIGPMSAELGLYPDMVERTYEAQSQYLEQHQNQIRQTLQHYCEIATAKGFACEFDYHIGDPGPSICETAKAWNADLILVGRRGRSGLSEALLGSVSNYVVHHAHCAVLVIQGTADISSNSTPSPESGDRLSNSFDQ
jgi:nucleotide-binding universal stress UspA family protein